MNKIITTMLCCLTLVSCFLLSGCGFGAKNKVTKITVYSSSFNSQYFVGEDWYDNDFKVVATYKDGSTKDVTKDANVDKSNYNKNRPGVYLIYVEYLGQRSSIKASVVNEINDYTSIRRKMDPYFMDAFKAKNGSLQYSINSSVVTFPKGDTIIEEMHYSEANGNIKVYYTATLKSKKNINDETFTNSVLLCKYLYDGSRNNATILSKKLDQYGSYVPLEYTGSLKSFRDEIEKLVVSNPKTPDYFENLYENIYLHTDYKSLKVENNAYLLKDNFNASYKVSLDGKILALPGVTISYTATIPENLN